jgi:CspA family cold shock protein
MASGRVKFFDAEKGYGFITSDEGGKDVYVHITVLQQSGLSELKEGQKVGFAVDDVSGAPYAKSITML